MARLVTENEAGCPFCDSAVLTDDSERTVYTAFGLAHRGCYDAAVSAGEIDPEETE